MTICHFPFHWAARIFLSGKSCTLIFKPSKTHNQKNFGPKFFSCWGLHFWKINFFVALTQFEQLAKYYPKIKVSILALFSSDDWVTKPNLGLNFSPHLRLKNSYLPNGTYEKDMYKTENVLNLP